MDLPEALWESSGPRGMGMKLGRKAQDQSGGVRGWQGMEPDQGQRGAWGEAGERWRTPRDEWGKGRLDPGRQTSRHAKHTPPWGEAGVGMMEALPAGEVWLWPVMGDAFGNSMHGRVRLFGSCATGASCG